MDASRFGELLQSTQLISVLKFGELPLTLVSSQEANINIRLLPQLLYLWFTLS